MASNLGHAHHFLSRLLKLSLKVQMASSLPFLYFILHWTQPVTYQHRLYLETLVFLDCFGKFLNSLAWLSKIFTNRSQLPCPKPSSATSYHTAAHSRQNLLTFSSEKMVHPLHGPPATSSALQLLLILQGPAQMSPPLGHYPQFLRLWVAPSSP